MSHFLTQSLDALVAQHSLAIAYQLQALSADGAHYRITIQTPAIIHQEAIWTDLQSKCTGMGIHIEYIWQYMTHHRVTQQSTSGIAHIKNIVAVMSAKGGVGKSNVSFNLACTMARYGFKVGILDADIYGPSLPKMLGTEQHHAQVINQQMQPLACHGLYAHSMGFLVQDAAIWRGPMVSQALQQLLYQTNWPELDYLFIDMPPGTGDISLTLAQKIPVTAALIVTTPQQIATLDAAKSIMLCQKLNIYISGLIENMSGFECPKCHHIEPIFAEHGAKNLADAYKLPLLASIPLYKEIAACADAGQIFIDAHPQHPATLLYQDIAQKLTIDLAGRKKSTAHLFNAVTVNKS